MERFSLVLASRIKIAPSHPSVNGVGKKWSRILGAFVEDDDDVLIKL